MISSSANETVKAIRKLRDKKYRNESGLAFIEGTKLVIDALEKGGIVEKLVFSEHFLNSSKRSIILDRVKEYQIQSVILTKELFATISTKDNPQGIGAVVRQQWMSFEKFASNFSGVWVALWESADPGNLGTIIRTVDASGGNGIILIGNTTDPYDLSAIRGSMGALFSMHLVKSDVNTLVQWISLRHVFAIGTSDAGKKHFRKVDYPKDMILFMGSEREGLPASITQVCSDIVRIPMTGKSDSLNLAVATGIVLYEIYDQHHGEGTL